MIWFSMIFACLFGAVIGSFLNVVIHRGPTMWALVEDEARHGDLVAPRSYCPSCREPIRSWNLIPVVSYLILRGRCAACGAAISPRYLVVELLAAGAGVAAFLIFGWAWEALAAAVFLWAIIALAAIDTETGFLPDAITLPLIAGGLLANAAGAFAPLADAVIGAVGGYIAFAVIGAVFKRVRGYEGLGGGDAKLLAAVGAWVGWRVLPPVVFAASVLTLAYVLVRRISGETVRSESRIAFGPGLCLAGAFALLVSGSAY